MHQRPQTLTAPQAVDLHDLRDRGFRYRMTRRDDADPNVSVVIEGEKQPLDHAYDVTITVPNNEWCLELLDARGWVPLWKW